MVTNFPEVLGASIFRANKNIFLKNLIKLARIFEINLHSIQFYAKIQAKGSFFNRDTLQEQSAYTRTRLHGNTKL
jgi:hypothetical protein